MLTNIIIFSITIVAELLLIGSLIFTMIIPDLTIWPAARKKSWQFIFTWTCITISFIGIVLLSILDWNSFAESTVVNYVLGAILLFAGFAFTFRSVQVLSLKATLGQADQLVTEGPYSFTRNPQYLSMIFIILGIILLSNSFFTLFAGIIGIKWFIIAPFVEEPWLEKQFGKEYKKYCKKVPRFIFI